MSTAALTLAKPEERFPPVRSFRTYVLADFQANNVAAMPVL